MGEKTRYKDEGREEAMRREGGSRVREGRVGEECGERERR